MTKAASAELDRHFRSAEGGRIASDTYKNIVGSPESQHLTIPPAFLVGGQGHGKDLSFGTGAMFSSVHDAPVRAPGDAGMPQTQSSIQQAVGAGKTIDWTTAEQNKQSGQQPNFILRSDGTLQMVHKPDNPNAPVNVEVENKNKSLNDAIKNANDNQKNAIKALIAIWKKDHPSEQVPSDWTDQLNSQPNLLPTDNGGSSGSQPAQPTDTGSGGSSGGGGGGGGSSGGGGFGGDSGSGGGGGSSGGGGGGGGGFGGDSGAGGGSSGGGGGGSSAGSDSSVNPSNVSLSGGETATSNQIMDILTKQYGLSAAGAAGVVGNMTQENSLHTDLNSGGLGLCQWIGGRQSACEAYASSHGESATSVQAQVGFMMQELQTQYPGLLQELKSTNNAQQAALDFSQQYERPGDPQNGKREGYAQSALNNYHSSAHA